MYKGVPTIRLEGDKDRALALIPEAKVLLYRTQLILENAGVSTYSMTQRIDDDSTIFVLCAHGQNIITISVAPDVVAEEVHVFKDEPRTYVFPSFYSGLVTPGDLAERARVNDDGSQSSFEILSQFAPTPNCLALHDELSVAGYQDVARLAVEPWGAFTELRNPYFDPKFSQYVLLRPSMYSGTMQAVVQVVMGLGHVSQDSLVPIGEEPSKYAEDVERYGVQIRYDYKHIRTHGITAGADGRLWLVEISVAKGVIARELPCFPTSETAAFRARAAGRGDTAMVTALDRLQCLPTGEAFPANTEEYNRLVERGEIIRLADPEDLSPYYETSTYSSVMGWAFNRAGSVAHNTGYYIGDNGFQRGVWYELRLEIGAVSEHWEPGDPRASGSASLRLRQEGYIYTPPISGKAAFVPIKFYEPLMSPPALLSHDGRPTPEAGALAVPYVDTVMFVAYINDELHTVRYFRTNESIEPEVITDTFPEDNCTYDGEWTEVTRSGISMRPGIYSNYLDLREEATTSFSTVHLESVNLGWDAPSSISIDNNNSLLRRNKRFKNTHTQVSGTYTVNGTAAAIPAYSREAYYLAFGKAWGQNGTTTQIYYTLLRDVTSYGGTNDGTKGLFINEPSVAPVPGAPINNPYTYFDFIVAEPVSNDVCGQQYANDGSWRQYWTLFDVQLPGGPPLPPTIVSITDPESFDESSLALYITGHPGPVELPLTGTQFGHWDTPSPDPETGNLQSIYAVHSCIGEDCIAASGGLTSYESEIKVVGYSPVTIEEYPCFVGVNSP